MFHFLTPWKRKENMFCDIFSGYTNEALAWNRLIIWQLEQLELAILSTKIFFLNEIRHFSKYFFSFI